MKFSKRIEASFVKDGFANWNDANIGFRKHQDTDGHKEAQMKLSGALEQIDEMLSERAASQKQSNTRNLNEVIRVLLFLCQQNIPLRG